MLFPFCSFLQVTLISVFAAFNVVDVSSIKSFKSIVLKSNLYQFHMVTTDRALDTLSYDIKAFENSYSSCSDEVCQVISESIPLDIVGTYFKNGYGKFEIGNEKILHPFDADGMIAAITFQNGKAIFRNRIIGTKGYMKEKRTKKISTRGIFGTQKKGGFLANAFDLNLKNTANTNVIYWGNQLLALWEGGLPHRMEADSLRTFGESRIRGLLKPKQPFSAHPKIDANTNRLVTFSVEQKGKTSGVTVYEFDDKFDLVKNRTFEIPGFSFFHDFVVTKNHYLFSQAPTSFDPLPFVLGLKTPAECILYDNQLPSKMYIIPRNNDDDDDEMLPVQVIEVPTHFNFHYANGYEDEITGNIIVDTIKCDKMILSVKKKGAEEAPVWMNLDYAKTVPYSKLTRYTLTQHQPSWTCSSSTSSGSSGIECLSETHMDFPVVNPSVLCKKHRYVYGICGTRLTQTTPNQGLVKLDLQLKTESQWLPMPYEFLSEPMFIPRNNTSSSGSSGNTEDDGYIATYLSNGRDKTTDFLLFNARNISTGPVLRVPLPVYLSPGLHGSYVNNLVFDEENIVRKFKVNKALDSKQTGRNGWNDMKGGFSGLGLSYDME